MDKNNVIDIETKLEARVKLLEHKFASNSLSWSKVFKILWPYVLVFVSAITFLLANIYNKAPAETVYKHSEVLVKHEEKLDQYEKRLKWLTETTFDIAKALGINPAPPP